MDDRYEIGLPLKDGTKLPNNRSVAENRLASLKRKLKCNPGFVKDYNQFMGDMIERGYVEIVLESEL